MPTTLEDAEYLTFGMPADSDLAKESDAKNLSHPDTLLFDLDSLERK